MVTDGRGKSKTRRNHSQEMGKYDWELLLESTRSSLESNFEPWKRISRYFSISMRVVINWVKKRNINYQLKYLSNLTLE